MGCGNRKSPSHARHLYRHDFGLDELTGGQNPGIRSIYPYSGPQPPRQSSNMIKSIFYLVVFLSVACLSLTINQSTQLLSLNNSSATTSLLIPGDIPNPFVYEYSENLRLEVTHKGSSHLYPARNPGVSVYNWVHAIEDAEWEASAMQRNARAGPKDSVPNDSFEYEDTLARPSPAHRIPRRIRVKITVARAIFRLRFDDIHLVLNGLKEYTKIWQRGEASNDQVKMCLFHLIWKGDRSYPIDKGSVELITEPSLIIDSK